MESPDEMHPDRGIPHGGQAQAPGRGAQTRRPRSPRSDASSAPPSRTYNDAVGSFDRRVVPQLRRTEAAGASSEKRLPSITTIEDAPRRSAAGLADDDAPRIAQLAPADADNLDDVA